MRDSSVDNDWGHLHVLVDEGPRSVIDNDGGIPAVDAGVEVRFVAAAGGDTATCIINRGNLLRCEQCVVKALVDDFLLFQLPS
ncbi:hypothetical protein F1880_009847 [Penicillium rolfsii]|nr:hypothetical protein F1880_009847 [Penicillium rolfsii]